MSNFKIVVISLLSSFLFIAPAYSESAPEAASTPTALPTPAKPYRSFITIQRYNMETNGAGIGATSNVRLEVTFPNGAKTQLPASGQYWPIGNGQTQEINRTFEIPASMVEKDGFRFTIQMVRQGSRILPCNFEVNSLSQFNRSYVCHTDVNYQASQNLAQDRMDKEGIEVRVFSDRNSTPNEIPQDAIALRE